MKLLDWLGGTPHRTFVLYPILVAVAASLRRGPKLPRPIALPLLGWGYLQYRLVGDYRQRQRAGSRGFASLPERLLQSGPYAYTRNPMYLGHLIFLLGLALAFRSRLGWLIFMANLPWFQARVRADEVRLREKFGEEFDDYCRRVPRWIPFVG